MSEILKSFKKLFKGEEKKVPAQPIVFEERRQVRSDKIPYDRRKTKLGK